MMGCSARSAGSALIAVLMMLCAPLLAGCLHVGEDTTTPVLDPVEVLYGCTDPTALNHDPAAEVNDGSCEYEATSEPEEHEEPEPPAGNETELEEQAQATMDLWAGENRVLLILVHPTDSAPELLAEEVDSITADVAAWFEEVSYGKVWLNWTVTNWYALDEASHSRQIVYQAAAADGHDLTQYDRMVVGLHGYTGRSSSTQGIHFYNVTTDDGDVQMLVSRCDVKGFANTSASRRTLTHELGHSFGLSHAMFNGSLTGEVDQYGNQLDTMGSSPGWRHFGAAYKHQMGWLDDQQVELVTQSGEYTLRTIEGEDPHALRISKGIVERVKNGEVITEEHFLFLEVREPPETDDAPRDDSSRPGDLNVTTGALNGVIVNHVRPVDQFGYNKWVVTALDATPETPTASSGDFQLLQGRTFSDSEAGIHITALNVTDNETTVRIVLGEQSANVAPTITSVEAVPGNAGFLFSVDATDSDGDGLAIFWNFEAGLNQLYSPERKGDGTPLEHTFPDDEGRRVHVRVSDMRGGEAVGWVDVWDYVNEAPVIEALIPTTVEEGVFEFRAAVLDRELLTYVWDFGDGDVSTYARPLHEYAASGNYTISLTVSDGEYTTSMDGFADTAETENQPPIADAGPDVTAVAGETVTLDGSGSDDPDNYPIQSMRFTWSSVDGLAIANAGDSIASVVAPSEPGTYEIRLLVNDGSASVTDSMLLTVTAA